MPIDVLRRLAATLAYRAAQVLRDAPPRFVASTFAPSTGQPVHIVAHMADLMAWGVTLARGDYVGKRMEAATGTRTRSHAANRDRRSLSGLAPARGFYFGSIFQRCPLLLVVTTTVVDRRHTVVSDAPMIQNVCDVEPVNTSLTHVRAVRRRS